MQTILFNVAAGPRVPCWDTCSCYGGRSHGDFLPAMAPLPAPTAGPVHAVICDMSPLRVPRAWVAGAGKLSDSHGQGSAQE